MILSQIALALDACGGLARILVPSAVNTASKELVNWPARSLIRNVTEVARREDHPKDLDRARAALTAWRHENPAGTPEQLIAALGRQFHRDYSLVLRGLLFAADRRRAREVTGIGTADPRRTQSR